MTFRDLLAYAEIFALYFVPSLNRLFEPWRKKAELQIAALYPQVSARVTGSPPKKGRQYEKKLKSTKGISVSKWRKVLVATTQSNIIVKIHLVCICGPVHPHHLF